MSSLKHHLLQKNSHIQWSWLPFPGSVLAIYHYWSFASFNLLSCPSFSVCSGVKDNSTLSLKTCHACWDLEFLLKAFVSILPKLGETFLRKKWQEDQTATVWYLLSFCPNHLFVVVITMKVKVFYWKSDKRTRRPLLDTCSRPFDHLTFWVEYQWAGNTNLLMVLHDMDSGQKMH